MRSLPPSSNPYGIVTTAQARDAGWTFSAINNAVEQERIVRVRRGMFVDAERMTGQGPAADLARYAVRSAASTLAITGSVASHLSAAALAGLPVWDLPSNPCVTIASRRSPQADDIHVHRATLPSGQVFQGARGLRTTSARTVVDVARECGIRAGVVVGDAALSRRMTTVDAILAVLAEQAAWPGARRAERMVAALDGRSESPLESVSRLVIADLRLPPAVPQVEIFNLRGQWLGRTDAYWDEFGVFGEVDGRGKYDTEEILWKEKRRQELFEDTGLIGVRWGNPEIVQPRLLKAKLLAAFDRGRGRPVSERRWVVNLAQPVPGRYVVGPINSADAC